MRMLLASVTTFAMSCLHGAPPDGPPPESLGSIELVALDGSAFPTAQLSGEVVLFVNVASRCGHTPQYAGLEALYQRYEPQGFTVVGTPCNQFLGQEPGSPEEIATFCHTEYGVTFPLLAKADVNGPHRHPLYQWLIASDVGGGQDISWNFEKFLVGRDGAVVARFAPSTEPDDPGVIGAIESALSRPR